MAFVKDTSGVVRIAIGEADAETYVVGLSAGSTELLPAPAYLECAMVRSGRLDAASTARLSEVLTTAAITIGPFTQVMAELAINAFNVYGKGRHKASLNLATALCMEQPRRWIYRFCIRAIALRRPILFRLWRKLQISKVPRPSL